ncbi:hypothetical protein HK104_005667 [Borealophlyctis nickersoniae]|nr:hypothetical protein HK104_005667 [Borealophlyctis nickersoniae]
MLLARSRNPKTGETKPGSKGLSLYLARVRDDEGKLNGVRIHRLKNKFGTKAVPTAELELNGMIGELVGEIGRGVPTIASILNITRIHSAKECVAGMRRAYALAKAYAEKRKAFGKPLTEQPLHITTLAEMEITYRACMQLLFFAVQLLGRIENADANSDTTDQTALRLVTPMLKAWVAKTSVGFISESMEALGGQGYMEEVGIGRILRDTQVNTIWEGTTNILSLDIIRVLKETKGGAMGIFEKVVINAVSRTAPTPALASAAQNVRQALTRIKDHVATIMASGDKATMEAGARALTFAMARTLSGALLIEHAEWQQRQAGRGGDADLTADADMQAAVRWCDSVASLLGDLKVRNVSSILNDAALVFGLKARI